MQPRLRLGLLLAAAFAAASGGAWASGLQVAPISLTLKPTQNADGLWLSDTGSNPIHAQVRVYRWTQSDGKDQLVPSRDLVVSPPMLAIAPGARQLIRVIRVVAPPQGTGAAEATYRLAIDELPVEPHNGKAELQFVLHYSLPVFVEPAAGPVSPRLQWQLADQGGQEVLQVTNTGTGHAQLSDMSYVDHAGKRHAIDGHRLGYVLPGATMVWPLNQPAKNFAGGGSLEARINGAPTTQAIPPADGAR